MARVIITIDAGPGASIGTLAGIIGDVSQVMDFGLTVDHAIAESAAVKEVDRLWRDQPGAILERLQGSDEGDHAEVRSPVAERRLFDEFLERGPFPPDLWFEEWYQFRRRALRNDVQAAGGAGPTRLDHATRSSLEPGRASTTRSREAVPQSTVL